MKDYEILKNLLDNDFNRIINDNNYSLKFIIKILCGQ